MASQERRDAGNDGAIGLIDAIEFVGRRVDMHQRLLRIGNGEARIAIGRHLAEARADDDEQITVFNALHQLGIGADAQIAAIIRMAIVQPVLGAERRADRQVPAFGKGFGIGDGIGRPSPGRQE